jgi:acyl carrier protein
MAALLETSRNAVFPAAEVEACIRAVLADQAADQAVLRPDRGTATAAPVAPRSWEPEIDSLVVVEVICVVEELLGIEISPTFSPKGGLRQLRDLHQRSLVRGKSCLGPINKGETTP